HRFRRRHSQHGRDSSEGRLGRGGARGLAFPDDHGSAHGRFGRGAHDAAQEHLVRAEAPERSPHSHAGLTDQTRAPGSRRFGGALVRRPLAVLVCLLLAGSARASAPAPDTILLEELTWTEVRDLIGSGRTTIILPTGGTEQN